ncbi:phosphotransferase family protein [Microlunatus parietis]|uniref:Aminoglycoside phosphotransferase (APT) family kinase protein n=1 Tax=Microlunatus parietis TaxID=682979 RepID=A0A7Y9LAI4_9ACTN|nr:aminoglycoside phosphotransferase family protein [Microlunatus parietis]NYE72884.1 aminoglycoside phosphotransferase (APT) family kinase protein [Microlunatus parietis]
MNEPTPKTLEPRRYSERLGMIDGAQLQAVADEFGLGRLIAAEPALAGLFGQILLLKTTGGEYALRGHPHGHGQLTKERCVAQLIHERSSLPAPWPYTISENTERFGWTYAVMPRLPGANGSTVWDSVDDHHRVAIAATCGDALGRLHESAAPFCGPYDFRLDRFTAVDDYPRWVLQRLEQCRAACREVDALTPAAEDFVDRLIEESVESLAEPFEPVLVHHDFRPGNLNLEQSGRHFVVTGVFDLFEAYFGNGEEDLVRMLRTVQTGEQRRAFVEAYTAHRPLRPGAAQRLALFALADWLIVWGYGKRHRVWFEDDASFLGLVGPIIDAVREIAPP